MQYREDSLEFICDTVQEANLLGKESWTFLNLDVLLRRVDSLASTTVDPTGLSYTEVLAAQAQLEEVRQGMVAVIAPVAGPIMVAECEQYLKEKAKKGN